MGKTLKPRPLAPCSDPRGEAVGGRGPGQGRLSPTYLRPGPHPAAPREGWGVASYLAFCVLFPARAGRLALALGNGASEEVLATLSLLSSR